MKSILTAIAATFAILAFTATADAGHYKRVTYFVGYDSCGHSIYSHKYVYVPDRHYVYDRCGDHWVYAPLTTPRRSVRYIPRNHASPSSFAAVAR